MQSQPQTLDKKILDEVRDVMQLHHYSIHTEQGGQGVPSPLDDLDVENQELVARLRSLLSDSANQRSFDHLRTSCRATFLGR